MRANGIPDFSLHHAAMRHIEMVLDYTDGDTAWAAQELGIHRTTLGRWQKAAARGLMRTPYGKRHGGPKDGNRTET